MEENEYNNKETLTLFEEVKNILSVDENGKIKRENLENFLIKGNDSLASRYICSKIPDFFARGSKTFRPFYKICLNIQDKEISQDQTLIKMFNGDFSDVVQFEKAYPYIKSISTYLIRNTDNIVQNANESLWENGDLFIKDWDNEYSMYYEKCIDHIKDGSIFNINVEDKKEKEFYEKIKNYCLLIESGEIFEPYSANNMMPLLNDKNEKLINYKKELEFIEKKLSKYNFITSLFRGSDKKHLLDEKNRIIYEMSNIEEEINSMNIEISKNEEKRK